MSKLTNYSKYLSPDPVWSLYNAILDFQIAFDCEIKTMEHARLYQALYQEELEEFKDAIKDLNPVEFVDALGDLLYIEIQMREAEVPPINGEFVPVFEIAASLGIDMYEVFMEVHRSNMSKLENGTVLRREDGKVLKGKDFSPPELELFAPSKEDLKLFRMVWCLA